jgi:hypothetical protein
MAKKFYALLKANLPNRIDINDELITAYSDVVFENGRFQGEILVTGVVHVETDEQTLGALVVDYLKSHTDFVVLRKVEIREAVIEKPNYGVYRKTGS